MRKRDLADGCSFNCFVIFAAAHAVVVAADFETSGLSKTIKDSEAVASA